MTELSKQATQDGMDQMKNQALMQAQKKEDLANTAANISDAPTREESNSLVKKAIDAGVDPSTIPLPGTPAFLTWRKPADLSWDGFES